MKITKNYLKQVIKEELGHLQEYEDYAPEIITINIGESEKSTTVEYRGAPVAPTYPEWKKEFDLALRNLKQAAEKLATYVRPKGMERY